MANRIYPTTPIPRSITIESIHQIHTQVAQNLSLYTSDRGGHRWRFEVEYPPLRRDDWSPLWAFLVGLKGRFIKFDFSLPQLQNRGSAVDADEVTISSTVASGNEVTMTGFNTSTNNVLRSGDFIRIGDSRKVYMVLDDVDSDASGEASVTFQPDLHSQATEDDAVYFSPSFQVSRTSDELPVAFSSDKLYDAGTLQFIEVV